MKVQAVLECDPEAVLLEDYIGDSALDDVLFPLYGQWSNEQMDNLPILVIVPAAHNKSPKSIFHLPGTVFHLFDYFPFDHISQP